MASPASKSLIVDARGNHFAAPSASTAWKGASYSRDALSGWGIARGAPDDLIQRDLQALRLRSADLARNNPLAAGAIATKAQGVIGTGLEYHASVDREVLELSDDAADKLEDRMERLFRAWANSKDCHVQRGLNFYQQQTLIYRAKSVLGDHFVQFCQVKNRSLPFSLALNHIAAQRVCNPNYTADTATLVGGIEKDVDGAPVRCHVLDGYPDGRTTPGRVWSPVPFFNSQNGRRITLHILRTLDVDQTRGIPDLSAVIEPLKQLDRFTDAELDAAVKNALWSIVIKSATGDGMAGGLDVDSWAAARNSFYDSRIPSFKDGSARAMQLFPDDDVYGWDPNRPNTAFSPFVDAVHTQIGVGLGIPPDIVQMRFNASYSASRAAILYFFAWALRERGDFAADFCNETLGAFMDEMVATGRVAIPGYFADPLIRVAALGAEWIGDARPEIDENKAVTAAISRIDAGLSNRKRECAALTGQDYDKIRRQLDKESRQGAPGSGAPQQIPSADDLDKADREAVASAA